MTFWTANQPMHRMRQSWACSGPVPGLRVGALLPALMDNFCRQVEIAH